MFAVIACYVLQGVQVFPVIKCGEGGKGEGDSSQRTRAGDSAVQRVDIQRTEVVLVADGAERHEAQSGSGQRPGPPKPLVTVTLGGLPSRRMICHPDHVTSLKLMRSPWVDAIV